MDNQVYILRIVDTKIDESFLLTGSATPSHKGILHSGAGRIAKLPMRPMSFYESGDSSGKVSLKALSHGGLTPGMTGDVDLRKLIELIVRVCCCVLRQEMRA